MEEGRPISLKMAQRIAGLQLNVIRLLEEALREGKGKMGLNVSSALNMAIGKLQGSSETLLMLAGQKGAKEA